MPNFIRAPSKPVNSSLQRFDARFFSINFRTGSAATVVADTADTLTVNVQFRSNIDLVGLFWNSADSFGHPLLKYATDKNYTGCRLAFVANFIDPYSASLTIQSGSKSYIYRVFPYKVNGSNVEPDITDALTQGTGPGLTYATASLFPSGVTVPTGYKIYVVDFSNLQTGYNYDEGVIPPTGIDNMFFAIVPTEYGLGASATLDDAANVNLTTWNISGVPTGFRTQVGDVFVVTYTQGVQFFTKEVTVRAGFTQGANTLTLPMDTPLTGVTWTGGRVRSKVLSLDSAIGDVALQFTLSNLSVTGDRTSIGRYYYPQPAHALQMTTGYDDTYNITPWRQVHQIYDLGYRNDVVCYMGASHYYQSVSSLVSGVYYNQLDPSYPTPINTPTVAWCESFFAELASFGLGFIWSTSLEILLSAIPDAWAQKDIDDALSATGYTPPTSFIAPTNADGKAYIISVFVQGLSLANAAGLALKFQMGEFWWWDGSYSNLKPAIYDLGTRVAYNNDTGLFAPPTITNVYQTLNTAERNYAIWLGNYLGQYTLDVQAGVKAVYPASQACLLFFSPQIFAVGSELLPLLNFPATYWKYPNFNFMQIEDYDWIIAGKIGRLALTRRAALGTGTLPNGLDELAYPINLVHYFIGFVFGGNDTAPLGAVAGTTTALEVWDYCSIALNLAIDAGLTHNYIWAYPQVIRDGIIISNETFIEPKFPMSQSWFCLPQPEFNTVIDTSEGDWETRINSWGGLARYSFILQSRSILPLDTGTVKGDFDNVMAFVMTLNQGQNQTFRTKKGVFRLNCQTDNAAINQIIATADGSQTNYQLIKTYQYDNAVYTRVITKPNAQPLIYFDGVLQPTGWYCDLFSGVVSFANPPDLDVVISATFTFDFPVRFSDDLFPFSLDTEFNCMGFDDGMFIEDMESINASPSVYGINSESILPIAQSYFLMAKPRAKSSFTSTEGGSQSRYSAYGKNMLLEFDMPSRDILPVETGTSLGDFNRFINFFLCIAQGQANSFRVKYPLDYTMTGQVIGVGDGVTKTFQIIKTYVSGSLTYTRTIKKPVVGTVIPHWSSGTFTYSVDHTKGLITFNNAPADGVIVSCDCEFHYIARFNTSKLETTLDLEFGSYGLGDIALWEVRE